MRVSKRVKGLIILFVCLLSVGCHSLSSQPSLSQEASDITCIDGDTFIINGEKVRLLAVDTPEIEHKDKEGNTVGINEPYGLEAKKFACSILQSTSYLELIRVEPHIKDKYDRSLYFVQIGKITLQELLLKEGLAEIKYVDEPIKRYDVYSKMINAQKQAKEKRLNLWSQK